MEDHIIFQAGRLELDLLDQRYLPERHERFICHNLADVIFAIKNMVVRGAPAIGVAAGYGCVLAARDLPADGSWREELAQSFQKLASARPTAVNLSWAIARMAKRVRKCENANSAFMALMDESRKLHTEDVAICRKLGRIGAEIIADGDTILTHCNAGALATAGYGTALGVIRAAHGQGKKIRVIADETRPLFQGSRLTAYELHKDGIPVSVCPDSACALLLSRGLVQLALTGADRIAANGDTANKIGTLGVAIIAAHYGIPFYIAAPLSTIDPEIKSGAEIPLEVRGEEEVTRFHEHHLAPEGVAVYNYAFDVTPASLICGIITEAGILRAPYEQSIAAANAAGEAS